MRLHRLSELDTAGLRPRFAPALDLIEAIRKEKSDHFRDLLAPVSPLYVARAPGRLDVMGGIADYSGSLVLELPLERSTFAIATRLADPRIEVASRRDGRWHFCATPLGSRAGASDGWAAYAVGAADYCLAREPVAPGERQAGVQLVVDSTVPEGKGVASSAALEVACMAAVAASCNLDLEPYDIATACQWVENHVVGAPCGIMDQMTSACGRADQLLRLRCQPATIEGYVDVPAGYRFYGIDSGVRHAVTGADYGTVRTAAFMGYRMIAELAGLSASRAGEGVEVVDPRWRGYLANLDPAEFASRFESRLPDVMAGSEFLERFSATTDDVTRVHAERRYPVRLATAHPIRENHRVERFAALLGEISARPSAANELGALMYDSHASYGGCGLASDGTDRLVELVATAGPSRGLFGAKITGAGSGGTVAIFGTAAAESLVRDIATRYSAETGRTTNVFAESGPGAEETGVLIV
jgi:galactokinase